MKDGYAYGVLATFLALMCLGVYGKSWESNQLPIARNAVIRKIETKTFHSDLGFPSVFKEILVEGDDKPLYFSSDVWDETAKEGDSVNLVAKRRFPLFGGFKGEYVNDNK